ncbi:MAG: hypothetical protein IJC45_11690 [Clostridia bacterium]|nr:hypothetical protein [Clostridia bacterium]
MRILSKIILPLTALCVILALLFLPILRVSLGGTLLSNQSLGIDEYNSVVRLVSAANDENSQLSSYIKLFKQYSENNDGGSIKELIPTINWLYAALACIALILVFVLLIMIFSIFTNKRMLTAGFAAGGMLSTVLMGNFFDKFAKPILNGTVNVSTLLSNINTGATTAPDGTQVDLSGALSTLSDALSESLGLNLSGLANSLVTFKHLEIGFASTGILLAFGAVIVLAIVFSMSIKNEDTGKSTV